MSSQCSSALGNSLPTASTNASRNSSYSSAGDARPPVADVQRVVEQALPVGADVEHDRQRPVRVDAAGRRVHGQLADRDVDAADAPVADAEDRAGVGRDDQVDLAAVEVDVAQRLLDQVGVLDRQVHAARPAVLIAVVLDRLADRGRVDDRQHLAQVRDQQPVEQHLVAVVDLGQQDVLRQVGGLALVLRVDPGDLRVQRDLGRRNQAGEAEFLPLGVAERGAAVQPGIGQDLAAAQRGVPPALVVQPQRSHAGPSAQVSASVLNTRRCNSCRSAWSMLVRLTQRGWGSMGFVTIKHVTASTFVFSKLDDEWRLGLILHPLFGRLMIPGGHVEFNESAPETARREVAEETGLAITIPAGAERPGPG